MKTNTTYPTKHPHWIDETEYLDAIKKRKRIGISFPLAFVLVLAIHLAGAAGIYAYSHAKPKKPVLEAEAPVEKPPGPKSDSLARNKWPQPEAQPKVVATPPLVKKQVATAQPAPEQKPQPVAAATPPVKKQVAAAQPAPEQKPKPIAAATPLLKKQVAAAQPAPEQKPEPPVIADTPKEKPAPTGIAMAAPKPSPASEPVASHPRPSEYTLAAGDNLYMVSRRLQVSYNELMQTNGITDPRQLRVGQKLKVPAEHIASL